MKKKAVLFTLIILGFYWLVQTLYIKKEMEVSNFLNPDNVKSQHFEIDASKDTVLLTRAGSMILINKNSFIDKDSNQVSSIIQLEYKEIRIKSEIYFANLTTLSNSRILESDGMIYINVFQNGKRLALSRFSKIGFVIENTNNYQDMMVFRGLEQDDKIDWVTPVSIPNDSLISSFHQFLWNSSINLDSLFECGVVYVDESSRNLKIRKERIDDHIENKNELTIFINKYNSYSENDISLSRINSDVNYLFESVNLGWINIDRFINDKNSKPVDFKVEIDNIKHFNKVSVKMIFKNRNCIFSLEQIKNNMFLLGNPSGKKLLLPMGEKVIIVAHSLRNNVPYFDYKDIVINKDQEFHFNLQPSTLAKIKTIIDEQ